MRDSVLRFVCFGYKAYTSLVFVQKQPFMKKVYCCSTDIALCYVECCVVHFGLLCVPVCLLRCVVLRCVALCFLFSHCLVSFSF